MKRRTLPFVKSCVAIAMTATVATGQDTTRFASTGGASTGVALLAAEDEGIDVVELGILVGADEPDPPLRYLFDPKLHRRESDNAVLHYLRATSRLRQFGHRSDGDTPWETEWSALPIEELPMEKLGQMFEDTADVYSELELASRCNVADWRLGLNQNLSLSELVALKLDEQQESRMLVRYLALRSRYEMALGDFDSAANSLRIAFALGKDVGEYPLLISGLVGLAIQGVAAAEIHTWIAQEDSPNLYWALTSLGAVPVDLMPGLVGETRTIVDGIEAFREPENKDWSADRWMDSLAEDLGTTFFAIGRSDDEAALTARAMASAMVFAGYQTAKERLLEEGFTAERIEAMPTPQVVCIYQSRTARRVLDAQVRWHLLRDAFGQRRMETETNDFAAMLKQPGSSTSMVLLGSLAPAFNRASQAELRHRRSIAALRAVEAIRLHVAKTGEIPASLDAIRVVPVPSDPRDGRPFGYVVTDTSVELTLEQPHTGVAARTFRWRRP